MKTKTSLSIFFCISFCFYSAFALAAPVDYQTARKAANSFFSENYRRTIQTPVEGTAAGLFYVFSYQPGFILVSSDDRLTPILAYSFDHPFHVSDLPPQLEMFTEGLQSKLDKLSSGNEMPDESVRRQWELFTSDSPDSRRQTRISGSFYLLSASWDQGHPYNLLCPEDPLGPNGRTYAGCLAIACVQIMKYWNYPAHGIDSITYKNKYGDASADFRNTLYEWDHMPDRLTGSETENPIPAATLIYHAGVSVKMDYGPYVSLAYTGDAVEAFKKYFGYSDAIRIADKDNKDEFPTEASWIAMLHQELDSGRPVIYSAARLTGYHAFNVDGYNSDGYFHVNFGWGGNSNGFYALNYFLSYTRDQSAIIGIQPVELLADFKPDKASGDIPLTLHFEDYSLSSASKPVSWNWDFGDGQTSNLQNPTHVYQKPGFYTVTLTVGNGVQNHTISRKNMVNAVSPNPIVYVAKTGSNISGNGTLDKPFATIQYGIDAAKTAVTVMPGTYAERLDFKGKNIMVGSVYVESKNPQDISNTIIDGGRTGTVVVFQSGETSAKLIGFTIRNGFSETEDSGGGITCVNRSSPVLSRLILSGNTAKNGGGVSILNSSPTLDHVVISGNTSDKLGGGVYVYSSSLNMTNCSVVNNRSGTGGGVYGVISDLNIRESAISGNQAKDGGGAYWDRCRLKIDLTDILNNRASEAGGGLYILKGEGSLNQFSVSGNQARTGGGIYLQDTSPNLMNMDISGNTADEAGGGAYFKNTRPTLARVTISGNTAAGTGGGLYLSGSSPVFDSENRCSIYLNQAVTGKDIYSDASTQTISLNLDMFTVNIPTLLYLFPPEKFSTSIIRSVRRQVNADLYVSPEGNDANSGLTPQAPLKTIDFALKIILTDDKNPHTIFLAPGRYSPSATGEKFPLTLISHTSITGAGDDVTIIDAAKTASVFRLVRYTKGVIQKVNIQNGSSKFGSGVFCDGSNPELRHVVINGNQASLYGGGVYGVNSSNPAIFNSAVIGNSAQHGAGLYLESGKTTITESLISDNISYRGGGIFCSVNAQIKLTDCTIADNSASFSGGGIFSTQSVLDLLRVSVKGNASNYSGGGLFSYVGTINLLDSDISENWSYGDGGGVWVDHTFLTGIGCTIHHNSASYGGGIFTTASTLSFEKENRSEVFSNEALVGKDLYSDDSDLKTSLMVKTFTVLNPTDLYAFPLSNFSFHITDAVLQQVDADLYVSPSGNDSSSGRTPVHPLKTIDAALRIIQTSSDSPKTIHLAPGTYSHTATGEQFPLTLFNYVSLKGDDQSASILDGNQTDQILFFYGVKDCAVESIQLINGRSDSGGAVVLVNSSPEFKRVRFFDNSASGNGGAIACKGHSNPKIIAAVIRNNRANYGGGVYCGTNSNPKFFDVDISGNYAEKGGGIYSDAGSYPAFQHVVISGNNSATGAGMFLDNSRFKLENVSVLNNKASVSGGGVYVLNSTASILNSIIARNSSDWDGSAVYSNGSSVELIFTTVSDNASQVTDAGIFISAGSNLNLINSILWDNGAKEVVFEDIGAMNSVTVLSSLIQGGETAVDTRQNGKLIWKQGNIDTDPAFINSDAGDYHLQAVSPCIDAGEPIASIQTDVDLDVRPQGSGVDIGADEVTPNNYLTVVQPNGGEVWTQGNEASIRWISSQTIPDVTIALYKGRVLHQIIAESVKNSRIFSWQIPSTLAPGTDYSIRISSASDSNVFGESLKYFFIESTIDGELALGIANTEARIYKQFTAHLFLENEEQVPIESFNTVLEFDPNQLVFISAGLDGGVLADQNYQLIVTDEDMRRIGIDCWSESTPYSGSGIVLTIAFLAVGHLDDTAVISVLMPKINSADVKSKSGLIHIVETTYHISGIVSNAADQTPVKTVYVSLISTENSQKKQSVTNSTGEYAISDIIPGNYHLTCRKTDDIGGITATDASRIARYAAKLASLDCHQMIAADVTQDGTITSTDASRVARYAAKLTDCLNEDCRHWTFSPEPIRSCTDWEPISYPTERQYLPMNSDHLQQNFYAYRLGDVTRGVKRTASPDKDHFLIQRDEPISWQIPRNAFCIIPIYMNDALTIEGLDFEIAYDSKYLTFLTADLSGGIFKNTFYSMVVNSQTPGLLIGVIYASGDFIQRHGIAAYIVFKSDGDSQAAQITLTRLDCNEDAASGGFGIAGGHHRQILVTTRPVNLTDVIQGLQIISGITPSFAYTWTDPVQDGKLDLKDILLWIQNISHPEG